MTRQSRLLWRCRRGIREMDLLLEHFLQQDFPLLDARQQQLFEEFLNESDMDIMAWLMNRAEPSRPGYAEFITRLQQIKPANIRQHE